MEEEDLFGSADENMLDVDALFDPSSILESRGLVVPESLTQRESDGGVTPPGTHLGPEFEFVPSQPASREGEPALPRARDTPRGAHRSQQNRPGGVVRNCWVQLDSICLETELRKRVPTIRDPPKWLRGLLRQCYMVSLHEWRKYKTERSWKLFILTFRMLLRPTEEKGAAGKAELENRAKRLKAGDWIGLLLDCHKERVLKPRESGNTNQDEISLKRRRGAENKFRLKRLSRASTH